MDKTKLIKLLHDFYEISGMTVCIFDSKFRYSVSANTGRAGYCEAIHRDSSCLNTCIKSDRDWLLRAQKEKRTITFVCPFGFFEAIAPIMKNGEVLAYLFLGAGIEAATGVDERILKSTLHLVPSADAAHIKECIKSTPHHPRARIDAIVNMLGVLADYIGQGDFLAEQEQTLGGSVKKYIDDNLDKKITLSELSWQLHRSTVSLTEHFKAEFGITIMEYVMRRRMERAEQMLIAHQGQIGDIAAACGFPDVEYFSRAFKKAHGISPKKWGQLNAE